MDLDRLDAVVPLLDPTALARVISRDEALRSGYTRDAIHARLASGAWRRVLPRTYLTSDTLTWADRIRAALIFAGPGSLLSGAAALEDQGLRAVTRPESVLVIVATATTCRSTGWVRIRRTKRHPRPALLAGPRRVPLARAVADLALERPRLDDVRALVAEVVRSRVCTIEELVVELREGPRNRSAHLRQAIDEVGGGAWSAPEARAAALLRRAGAPPFEQNTSIRLSSGRLVIVDFLWRELRAVLEIDSDTHHALAGDADSTSDRHLQLETDGFSVIHRTPRYVIRRPDEFTGGVISWLGARATLLG